MRTPWKRGSQSADFDARVRARRPAPRAEFVQLLAERVESDRRVVRRPVRIAGAVAFVTTTVAMLAAAGGLGYASSLVQQGVSQAKELVSPGAVTVAASPADKQYRPGKGCGDKNHIHDRNFQCKMSINDVTAREGNSGFTAFVFTVSLNDFAIDTVTAAFATLNGTATAPSDYLPVAGTVTFNPGQSTKTITVSVVGDTVAERDETFRVILSNPSDNALILKATGTGTIRNDDR